MLPLARTRDFLDNLTDIESKLSTDDRAIFRKLLPAHASELAFLFASPKEILTPTEQNILARLQSEEPEAAEPCGLRSYTVLVMKATRLCNLRCTYCHSWKEGPNQTMDFEVLARTTRDVFNGAAVKHVTFVWHGGEVTMLPISFFQKALWLQQLFRRNGQTVSNSIQTNATRLTDEWIALFKAGRFQVGVSVDGPREIHDLRRRTRAGSPTWETVRTGADRLRQSGLPWGALVVVDRHVIAYGPDRLLDSLLELGAPGAALLNVIPPNDASQPNEDQYLSWPNYVNFLHQLFTTWWRSYRDRIEIRELRSLVNILSDREPEVCLFAGNCMGQFLTIEPRGGVSACDKYIGDPQFEFGNLLHSNLGTMLAKSTNLAHARRDGELERQAMDRCKYFTYCRGGCPHDRRLNRLHRTGWDGRCCGLSHLLDHINTALHNESV